MKALLTAFCCLVSLSCGSDDDHGTSDVRTFQLATDSYIQVVGVRMPLTGGFDVALAVGPPVPNTLLSQRMVNVVLVSTSGTLTGSGGLSVETAGPALAMQLDLTDGVFLVGVGDYTLRQSGSLVELDSVRVELRSSDSRTVLLLDAQRRGS